MGKEFDAEKFDYDKSFEEIKNQVKKPNIMICGATGAGKSSLTNDIFGEVVTNTGSGRPETRGVNLYTSEESTVNLFDTEGYEVGQDRWEYYKENIIGYIKYRQDKYPQNIDEHIHEVWYCVNAANNRLLDADISTIQQILDMKLPIAIIITQIDTVAEDELNALIESVKTAFPSISYFTYCVTNDTDVLEAVVDYIQKKELLKWAEEHLEDSLREGFVCAVQGSIDDKKKLVKKKIIPKYAALAAAAVAIPIPCADSAALMPIQVTMTMHIMRIYGIDKISGAISRVVSSTIISTLGKSLAGSLVKLIPDVGTVFGTMVNAGVATSITYVLGLAISELSYRYAKAKADGKDVPLEDYFNSEMLSEMIDIFSKEVNSSNE